MSETKIRDLKAKQAKNVSAMVKKNAKLEKKIFVLVYKKLANRIKSGKPWEPKVGDLVYAPTQLYMSHGADDIAGGLATITSVKDDGEGSTNSIFVTFKEIEDGGYNWNCLMDDQKDDHKRYGKEFAHPDPDDRPEFNDNEEGWQ